MYACPTDFLSTTMHGAFFPGDAWAKGIIIPGAKGTAPVGTIGALVAAGHPCLIVASFAFS